MCGFNICIVLVALHYESRSGARCSQSSFPIFTGSIRSKHHRILRQQKKATHICLDRFWKDKVANFWCSISVLVKLKNLYTVGTLKAMCFFVTFILLLPSSINLFLNATKQRFLLAVVSMSLAVQKANVSLSLQ